MEQRRHKSLVRGDNPFPGFSERFRALQVASGENNTEIGRRLKISRQTISRYANGETSPELPLVVAIAQHYHVSVDWLLGLPAPGSGDNTPALDTYIMLDQYNRASDEDRELIRSILHKYSDKTSEEFMRVGLGGVKEHIGESA